MRPKFALGLAPAGGGEEMPAGAIAARSPPYGVVVDNVKVNVLL